MGDIWGPGIERLQGTGRTGGVVVQEESAQAKRRREDAEADRIYEEVKKRKASPSASGTGPFGREWTRGPLISDE